MNLINEEWIGIKEALLISRSCPKGPNERMGLILAGKKANFIRKAPDGFRWEFNRVKLKRYCEISGSPTLRGIANLLSTSVGAIKYIAMKYNIPFKIEMGRKYLELEDADKLIELYKEDHYGQKDKSTLR